MEVQAKQHLSDELNKIKSQSNQAVRKSEESERQLATLRNEITKLRKDNEMLRTGGGGDFSFSFLNFLNSDELSFSSPSKLDDLSEVGEEPELDSVDAVSTPSKDKSLARTDSYKITVEPSPKRSDTTASKVVPPRSSSISANERNHPVATTQEPEKAHRFFSKTFVSPTKCHNCMSIMVGHTRQGMICDVCNYHCHMHCVIEAPNSCPVPPQLLTNRPLGIDPKKGTGTAHEGLIRVPKPGGVKRGWMRAYAVVCDFKVFIYESHNEKQSTNNIVDVLDMKDEEFSVSGVLASDVIHANKRDVPSIFKITVCGFNPSGNTTNQLILCDSENDRHKWVGMLNELLQVYNKNHGKERKNKFQNREICDSSISILKSTLCSTIVNPDKIVLGTDEGLYAYELNREVISRIDDIKKVAQVEMIPEEQLLIVLAGKQRHIRLYPLTVVEGHEIDPVKLPDSKGALSFTTGSIRQGSCTCLCVAQKKNAVLYELNRTKTRYRKLKDVPFNLTCQWLGIYNNNLFIGYPSGFAMVDVLKDNAPLKKLVNYEDPSLKFMQNTHTEALLAVQVTKDEYFLCFSELAFYVNASGYRSRSVEVAWPTPITHLAYMRPYVLSYSDRGIDIFDSTNAKWLQTLQLKNCQPLSTKGTLSLMSTAEQQSLLYIGRDDVEDELIVKSKQGKRAVAAILRLKASKKRLSFKTRESLKAEEADLVSKLISGPSNFNHVTHMGPGDGLQILKDIPKVDDKLALPHIPTLAQRPQSMGPRSRPPPQHLRAGGDISNRPASTYHTSQSDLTADSDFRQRPKSMDVDQYDPDTLSSSSTASNTSGQNQNYTGSSMEEIR